MTKRDFIYAALLISLAAGSVIDAFTGGLDAPGFTLNDATQLIATVVLCVWWEMEDARLRGGTAATLIRTATILSRRWGYSSIFSRRAGRLPRSPPSWPS